MAKDFLSEIDNSYIIPSQILVGNGDDPVDVRQTCDTVDDFQDIADLGMELRYDGLITYEKDTGLWKGCRKKGNAFEWITLNSVNGAGMDPDKFALKGHIHKEYLPELSEHEPDRSMPVGHVWLDV